MTNITHFTEISLVVGDSRPGYASTWATTDRAEALARITKEIDSARSRVYGPSYKAFTEVLPRQGAYVETLLRARDPDRALFDVFGDIPW